MMRTPTKEGHLEVDADSVLAKALHAAHDRIETVGLLGGHYNVVGYETYARGGDGDIRTRFSLREQLPIEELPWNPVILPAPIYEPEPVVEFTFKGPRSDFARMARPLIRCEERRKRD